MNGICLLISLALQAQVGNPLVSPDSTRDFGWMIDKDDGALVYIVQVSPNQAEQMELKRLENLSNIPPELVGRATRISVRIGTEILPRSPSLAEIDRRPRYNSASDVTAALGPGRMSDVDGAAVVNVQEPGIPSLPTDFGGVGQRGSVAPNSLSNQAPPGLGNVIDRASQIAGAARENPNLADQFLSGASGGQATLPPVTLPGVSADARSTAGRTSTSRFNDTGGRLGDTANSPAGAFPRGLLADDGQPTASWQSQPNAERTPPSLANAGGFDARIPTNPTLPQRTPTPNFGSTPGTFPRNSGPFAQDGASPMNDGNSGSRILPGHEQQYAGQTSNAGGDFRANNSLPGNRSGYGRDSFGYGREGYGDGGGRFAQAVRPPFAGAFGNNSGYEGVPHGYGAGNYGPLPNGQASPTQVAANNANNSAVSDGNPRQRSDTQSASDRGSSNTANTVQSTGDVLVQMFFLVSLVSNVYLVFLIRKLLMRYRSLLSTVRSQTV